MSDIYDPRLSLTAPYTAEIEHDDWTALHAAMIQAGMSNGAPPPNGIYSAAEIDGPIAGAAVCPTCGKHMTYMPMSKPGCYRSFAVCLGCNHAAEF